jgi:hypothetical protein
MPVMRTFISEADYPAAGQSYGKCGQNSHGESKYLQFPDFSVRSFFVRFPAMVIASGPRLRFDDALLVMVSRKAIIATVGGQALRMEGAGERNDAWAHVKQSQL